MEQYYKLLDEMRRAISARRFELAAKLARDSLPLIPSLVRQAKCEYGSFDIAAIPALEQGGTMLALVGDSESLSAMRAMVNSVPELDPWKGIVDQHEEDLRLFRTIVDTVGNNPSSLQTEIKKLVGIKDGHRAATMIAWLEKAGLIRRTPKGRTYTLTRI